MELPAEPHHLVIGQTVEERRLTIVAQFKLNQIDKLEILTLEDNYLDLVSGDNSDIVTRAMPLKDMQLKNSILAEHGFSATVTTITKERSRMMLFDFGFSEDVVARNAGALGVDLTRVEVAALSHGHIDHYRRTCASSNENRQERSGTNPASCCLQKK